MEGDAPVEGAEWLRFDPRKVDLDREIAWIRSAVLSLLWLFGTIIVCFAADLSFRVCLLIGLLWIVATVGITMLGYHWPAVAYRHMRYRIDAELIEIESGVFFRTRVTVPRTRVQHLDVSQGPLQRRHGLGVLSIYTAGNAYSLVTLAGLGYEVAQQLRDRLLPRETRADGV